jgi:predicted phage-related endonuclease
MMIEEFEKLTGIFPSADLYEAIDNAYNEFHGDKVEFCKAFKTNAEGLAEKIKRAANTKSWKANDSAAQERKALNDQIESLKQQLEREQEWKPIDYEATGNLKQSEYAKLANASCPRIMTDEEAKDLLYDWYGFAKEKVTIHHEIDKLEVNRHRALRKVGTISREPLYNATDWNYIRFDCGCMSYELINDNLRPFVR